MTKKKKQHMGWSTCPICGKKWLVTVEEDCLLPSCGCYGNDVSETNRDRPCFRCGLMHALYCKSSKNDKTLN